MSLKKTGTEVTAFQYYNQKKLRFQSTPHEDCPAIGSARTAALRSVLGFMSIPCQLSREYKWTKQWSAPPENKTQLEPQPATKR